LTRAPKRRPLTDRSAAAAALAALASRAHPGPAALARLERLLTAPDQRRTRAAGLAATAGLLPAAAVACAPLTVALCAFMTRAG